MALRCPVNALRRSLASRSRKWRRTYLNHHADEWSAKSLARYRTLLKYAASLDNVPVNLVTTRQIADVLRPIWSGPTNRGGKLRSLIERILTGKVTPNPAAWGVLSLPEYKLALKAPETKSHPAMPASEIPAFVKRLDMKRAADRAILLVILTGVRRSEATGATWDEFDLANKRWLIPATRMKTGKDHFVPLSDAAIACVGELGAPNDLVFSGAQGHDAMRLSHRFGLKYDLHGFRSTLASWAEENGYRTNVIQLALAHRKKTDDGRALGSQDLVYMRNTLFDDRRKLHDAWAAFVIS
jgi:integrase